MDSDLEFTLKDAQHNGFDIFSPAYARTSPAYESSIFSPENQLDFPLFGFLQHVQHTHILLGHFLVG